MTWWQVGFTSGSRKPVRRGRRLQGEGLELRRLSTVAISEFPIPTAKSSPSGITAGPDGNLWFTEQAATRSG